MWYVVLWIVAPLTEAVLRTTPPCVCISSSRLAQMAELSEGFESACASIYGGKYTKGASSFFIHRLVVSCGGAKDDMCDCLFGHGAAPVCVSLGGPGPLVGIHES